MSNLRQLSQSINQIDFQTPSDHFDLYYQNFLASDLGCFYQSIPWQDLTKSFCKKIKRKHTGRPSIFDLQGKLALMFLKAYTEDSDRKLIERLNSDYHFQFFCGLYLRPEQHLKDYKIVSHIRCELGRLLHIEDFQNHLITHWKPYMKELGIFLTDATCYETTMRYPTNVKLLWEACEWIYRQMKKVNKVRKGRMPRSKYGEQKNKYLAYQKSRKKTLRSILAKERATRMEGSFGTEKQYYSLNKIKARTEKTEILWICFGIHTANAVRIAKRIKATQTTVNSSKTVA